MESTEYRASQGFKSSLSLCIYIYIYINIKPVVFTTVTNTLSSYTLDAKAGERRKVACHKPHTRMYILQFQISCKSENGLKKWLRKPDQRWFKKNTTLKCVVTDKHICSRLHLLPTFHTFSFFSQIFFSSGRENSRLSVAAEISGETNRACYAIPRPEQGNRRNPPSIKMERLLFIPVSLLG